MYCNVIRDSYYTKIKLLSLFAKMCGMHHSYSRLYVTMYVCIVWNIYGDTRWLPDIELCIWVPGYLGRWYSLI